MRGPTKKQLSRDKDQAKDVNAVLMAGCQKNTSAIWSR